MCAKDDQTTQSFLFAVTNLHDSMNSMRWPFFDFKSTILNFRFARLNSGSNLVRNFLRYNFRHICKKWAACGSVLCLSQKAKDFKGRRNPTLICACCFYFHGFNSIKSQIPWVMLVWYILAFIHFSFSLLCSFFVSLHYWDAFVRAKSPSLLYSLANNFDVRFIWCLFSSFHAFNNRFE